jgi:transcriptional regulator with XRE-family HTH domain
MQISARIADFMEIRKWNKTMLAKEIGKNPSEITKWLSGTHNFTIDVLSDITFTFGVKLNDLFTKAEEQSYSMKPFVVHRKVETSKIESTETFEDDMCNNTDVIFQIHSFRSNQNQLIQNR